MDYFHTDDAGMTIWLSNVFGNAASQKLSVRIAVDSNNNLKIKVGEGMWTAPFRSTPDPSRDPYRNDGPIDLSNRCTFHFRNGMQCIGQLGHNDVHR